MSRAIEITPRAAAELIQTLKRTLDDLKNSEEPDSPEIQVLRRSILDSISELEALHLR